MMYYIFINITYYAYFFIAIAIAPHVLCMSMFNAGLSATLKRGIASGGTECECEYEKYATSFLG